jgi:hypothetical protein
MARPIGEHLNAEHGLRLGWPRTECLVARRVVKPLQSFLDLEAAGGTNPTIRVGQWAILSTSDLAFAGGSIADTTKTGVLAASLVAGAIGYAVLRRGRDARVVRR